eukprot:862582_1
MGICLSTSAVAAAPQTQPYTKPAVTTPVQKSNVIIIPQETQAQPAVPVIPEENEDTATKDTATEDTNNFISIGAKAGILPSPQPTALLVKEKLFSGDSFHIRHLPNREPFKGLHIKGKRFTRKDEMALLDGNGNILVVCLQKFDFGGKTFKIAVPQPVFAGQQPDEMFRLHHHTHRHQAIPMYTYCVIKHVPFHNGQDVFMASSMGNMMSTPAYEVRRLPGFGPKKLVMKRTGMEAPLAMVEGNMLNVNPGSDPCLMICFLAVSDEMDDHHHHDDPMRMMERDMMRGEMRGGGRRRR